MQKITKLYFVSIQRPSTFLLQTSFIKRKLIDIVINFLFLCSFYVSCSFHIRMTFFLLFPSTIIPTILHHLFYSSALIHFHSVSLSHVLYSSEKWRDVIYLKANCSSVSILPPLLFYFMFFSLFSRCKRTNNVKLVKI